MRKIKFQILIPLLLISLVGCAEQKLLERVGLAILLGYDLGNEGDLSTTAVIRQVNPDFESNIEIISAENQTSKGTRTKINRKSSKKIVAGQLRVALYGNELAKKKGISTSMQALSRDSNISGSVYMAVVEGEAKTLLNYKFENISDIGQHIFKLLQQNIEDEQIVSSTLHEVSHDYYSIGEDIAMPIISREEELIIISGVALFKKGRMVGELPAEDSFYIKLSRDRYDSGTFEVLIKYEDLEEGFMENPPEEISLVLDTIKSKSDLKLINQSTPEFDLNITMEARLLELDEEIDLGEPKNVAILDKAISKSLSREISRVITYCQEVNSDVFGLGSQYRSSVRNSDLTEGKWHEMYQKAKVNVKVDLQITRSGTAD
ncbi:Ger(x)C family spore germination protein [Paenisporosarcina macmurdoensis]|uniref:Ger(X)C family spore germination protein n=1 Tax=Paenisporosarcina macmurdoensis TaxID=212659 RepID=A0ABW1L3M7_9BACL